jgi:hypothetical protein
MKTLDELLDIDASCAKESELVFKDLPESLACANAGLMLFEEAGQWMSAFEADNPAQKRFDEAVLASQPCFAETANGAVNYTSELTSKRDRPANATVAS